MTESLDRALPSTDNRCPTCQSPCHGFRNGSCLVIRCSSPSCHWEVATTFPVPILHDDTRYSIVIPALSDATPAMFIELNKKFTHGISVTRRLALRGELPPFEGSAHEVWHEAHRLRDGGIPFRIEPNYPFDLDVPETAFGPPDGPLTDDCAPPPESLNLAR
ncbi:MAG: hypothetical protein EOP83_19625 [Verrucomicrobiaceae bacterium]|nr:MAG: hypothetical protein EOP83_19625 [Verrucomicrobiaceae bacterium]